MKNIFLIILLMMLIATFRCSSGSENKNYCLKEKKIAYNENQGIGDTIKRSYSYLAGIYNEKLKPINIAPSGKLKYIHEFNKDVRGKPGIKSIILEYYHFYQNQTPGKADTMEVVQANCRIYNYNSDGFLIEELIAYKSDTATISKYSYDKLNNLIKVHETNLFYEKSGEYYFIYDEKWGLLRKSSLYHGNPLALYNYDSLGRVTQEIMVIDNDKLGERIYLYFENSVLVKSMEVKTKDMNSLFKYRYNNKRQLIYEFSKSTLFNRSDSTFYTYNKKGDIIHKESSGQFVSLIEECKYEYDKKGNWTKKMVYINGKEYDVIMRFIEYY